MPPKKRGSYGASLGDFGEYRYPERILRYLERSEDAKFDENHEEAIRWAKKAVIEMPDCAGALEEIADNELSLDNEAAAEIAAKRALEINPNSFSALYFLGFIESNRNHFKESIRLLRLANAQKENSPEILRCLGWSLFMIGEYQRGMTVLERALNLQPNDSLILCDLGICHMRTESFEKSIALLEQAQHLDPEDPRIRESLMMAKEMQKFFRMVQR